MTAARRFAAWGVGAGLLLALLQLLAVLNPDVVEADPEELYNASHALALAHGHLGDAFRLQYRPFCGGCTLDALLAAPLFVVLPARWPVWKLVPLGYLLLLLGVGLRRLPPASRGIFALLLLLPPLTWLSLSMVAWGNHYEAGVLAAVGLLLLAEAPRRPLLGGLALGGAVWVGFSGAFALPAAVLWLLVQRDGRALGWMGAGVLLGVSPWLLLWGSADASPFGEIYGAGEAIPALSHIPAQAMTLLHPRQLAGLLGHPWLGLWSLPVAGAWLVAGGIARRHPLGQVMLLGLLCWLGVYLLSGFHIPVPEAPLLPVPASLRYLAPVLPLLLVVMAVAAGTLREQGRGRGGGAAAAGLLALPLLLGVLARVSVLAPPFPVAAAWTMAAQEPRAFWQQAASVLDRDTHRSCRAAGDAGLHGYAIGRLAAEVALEGNPDPVLALTGLQPPYGVDAEAFFTGAAAALIDRLDVAGEGDLAALSAGVAATADWPGVARREVLRARSGAVWLSDAIESHDEAAVARLQGVLAEQPAALWWLVGWRWGEDISRPLVPAPDVALPQLNATKVPADFAEGLGAALGERWGGAPSMPLNLPVAWTAAFVEGHTAWAGARWGVSSTSAARDGAQRPRP